MNELKMYLKTHPVKAKLFVKGDEDGFINPYLQAQPYVKTYENNKHHGSFGDYYICIGIEGERWLVKKEIFEATYKEAE